VATVPALKGAPSVVAASVMVQQGRAVRRAKCSRLPVRALVRLLRRPHRSSRAQVAGSLAVRPRDWHPETRGRSRGDASRPEPLGSGCPRAHPGSPGSLPRNGHRSHARLGKPRRPCHCRAPRVPRDRGRHSGTHRASSGSRRTPMVRGGHSRRDHFAPRTACLRSSRNGCAFDGVNRRWSENHVGGATAGPLVLPAHAPA
jgi:hypothetical protein